MKRSDSFQVKTLLIMNIQSLIKYFRLFEQKFFKENDYCFLPFRESFIQEFGEETGLVALK